MGNLVEDMVEHESSTSDGCGQIADVDDCAGLIPGYDMGEIVAP